MPTGKSQTNTGILEYALKHLEHEREEIQTKIEHVLRQLGRPFSRPAAPAAEPAAAAAPAHKKRVLSASARKRIALAQKRRWAEHRKAEAKAGGKETKAAAK